MQDRTLCRGHSPPFYEDLLISQLKVHQHMYTPCAASTAACTMLADRIACHIVHSDPALVHLSSDHAVDPAAATLDELELILPQPSNVGDDGSEIDRFPGRVEDLLTGRARIAFAAGGRDSHVLDDRHPAILTLCFPQSFPYGFSGQRPRGMSFPAYCRHLLHRVPRTQFGGNLMLLARITKYTGKSINDSQAQLTCNALTRVQDFLLAGRTPTPGASGPTAFGNMCATVHRMTAAITAGMALVAMKLDGHSTFEATFESAYLQVDAFTALSAGAEQSPEAATTAAVLVEAEEHGSLHRALCVEYVVGPALYPILCVFTTASLFLTATTCPLYNSRAASSPVTGFAR
ncbi:hypothetical protein VOLCADRAFT_100682 [Volvox carteri f. nagariensis]|uniref:Uncharacterized protein n=1 Tax=Volvox carteri f. nagariensis TaxID=3068 RepID=D8UKS4_VOLCA|nr:uncharacterized protein VOLCADRAFT_100682 [Volvox carteri f. nagariensis]EFJ39670.1 hypothetical protein VOLCADRAFT_100682 [Volvox carteri f. nagariensis]|eukprot:XP_002959259.1 hypothetical protein VOLCADRAFT_100682 [Volvox carteri f. nagariensis]